MGPQVAVAEPSKPGAQLAALAKVLILTHLTLSELHKDSINSLRALSGLASLQALASAWLLAQSPQRSLELARQGQALDPAAQWPALLGLQIMQTVPAGEELILEHLRRQPEANPIRAAYARALSGAQRYGDAIVQLEDLTRRDPARPSAWLTLGALQLELRKADAATRSIETFLKLTAESPPAVPR